MGRATRSPTEDAIIRPHEADGQSHADLRALITGLQAQIDSGSAQSVPPGFMMHHAAASGPGAGWLKCEGQAVSRTTYAALFAAITTEWGAGDGSTTFNLPPNGRFLVAAGAGRAHGSTGGSETHQHAMASRNQGNYAFDQIAMPTDTTTPAANHLPPYTAAHLWIKT